MVVVSILEIPRQTKRMTYKHVPVSTIEGLNDQKLCNSLRSLLYPLGFHVGRSDPYNSWPCPFSSLPPRNERRGFCGVCCFTWFQGGGATFPASGCSGHSSLNPT